MADILKDSASGFEFLALGETTAPKRILVVLHGTGDNCQGIAPVGNLFVKSLPGTLVLVPNGPVPLSAILTPEQIEATKKASPGFDPEAARNWTGVSKTIATDDDAAARALDEIMTPAVSAMNAFLDGQLKKYALQDHNLVVYGFSAGGVMALHSVIERSAPCAGVISHSGHFLGALGAVSKPNALMIFGDQEMAHPQISEMFTASAEFLRHLGLPVKEHVCKDLAHGINQEAFETACGFIATSFGMAEDKPAAKSTKLKPPQF